MIKKFQVRVRVRAINVNKRKETGSKILDLTFSPDTSLDVDPETL